ncbi:hypothetical protein BLNAU_7779 [Blattamonas nauphoetae]|uniref:Alkyl hydroperoxide reductase subunit C/ Thiol specific antioxidant domain-containing protein n=1 Tax=Blattamonas nauphoetae TaxID=2049346 RepID=A0ABQ9Y0B0_9EUKA|nr:hypothetical protein BLNAU_7779 [Blattamonas nauphoetae]
MCLSKTEMGVVILSYGVDGAVLSHPIEATSSPSTDTIQQVFPLQTQNIDIPKIRSFITTSSTFSEEQQKQFSSMEIVATNPPHFTTHKVPSFAACSLRSFPSSPSACQPPHSGAAQHVLSDTDARIVSSSSGMIVAAVTHHVVVFLSGRTLTPLTALPSPNKEMLGQAAASALEHNLVYENWRQKRRTKQKTVTTGPQERLLNRFSETIPSHPPLFTKTPSLDPNDGWVGASFFDDELVVVWTSHPLFFVFRIVHNEETPASKEQKPDLPDVSLKLVDCTGLTRYPHFFRTGESRFGFGSFSAETQFELCRTIPVVVLPNKRLFYFSPHPQTPTLHSGRFIVGETPTFPHKDACLFIPNATSCFADSFPGCLGRKLKKQERRISRRSTPFVTLQRHPSLATLFTIHPTHPKLTFTPFPSYSPPSPPDIPIIPSSIVTSIFIPPAFPHLILTGEYTVPTPHSAHVDVAPENTHSAPVTFFSAPSLEDIQLETQSAKDDETRKRLDIRRKVVVQYVLNTLNTRNEKKGQSKQQPNNVVRYKAMDDLEGSMVDVLSSAEIELLRLLSTSEKVSPKKLLKQVPPQILKGIASTTDEIIEGGEEREAEKSAFTVSALVASVSLDNTVCIHNMLTLTQLYIIPQQPTLQLSNPFIISSLEWNSIAHILSINSHSKEPEISAPPPLPPTHARSSSSGASFTTSSMNTPVLASSLVAPSDSPLLIDTTSVQFDNLLPVSPAAPKHETVLVDTSVRLFDDSIFFNTDFSSRFLSRHHPFTVAPDLLPLTLLVPNTSSPLTSTLLSNLPSSQSFFIDHGYSISDHLVSKRHLPPLPFCGEEGVGLAQTIISSVVSAFSTTSDSRHENSSAMHLHYVPPAPTTFRTVSSIFQSQAPQINVSPITATTSAPLLVPPTTFDNLSDPLSPSAVPMRSLTPFPPARTPPLQPYPVSPRPYANSEVFVIPKVRDFPPVHSDEPITPSRSPSLPVTSATPDNLDAIINQPSSENTTLIDLQTGIRVGQGSTVLMKTVLSTLFSPSTVLDKSVRQKQFSEHLTNYAAALDSFGPSSTFSFAPISQNIYNRTDNPASLLIPPSPTPQQAASAPSPLSTLLNLRPHEMFTLTSDDLPMVDHLLRKGFTQFNPPTSGSPNAALNRDVISSVLPPLVHNEMLGRREQIVHSLEAFLWQTMEKKTQHNHRHRSLHLVRYNSKTFFTFFSLPLDTLPPLRPLRSLLNRNGQPKMPCSEFFNALHTHPTSHSLHLPSFNSSTRQHTPIPSTNIADTLPLASKSPFSIFHFILPAYNFTEQSSLPAVVIAVDMMLGMLAGFLSLSHRSQRITAALGRISDPPNVGDGNPFLFAPSLSDFETQFRLAANSSLDDNETLGTTLLSLVPLFLPFGLSEENDALLLKHFNLPNAPLLQHGYVLSPPSSHSITLTLPIASAGMRAFTHTSALSSILSFFCLSLFNILGESRFFEDADTKSKWSMFIQSQSSQLLSKIEESLANNTSNQSTPNSQFVPPSLSYISTLIPSVHLTSYPSSSSPASDKPFAVQSSFYDAVHSLLSILIRTMSKPTTHRLADICGQLLLSNPLSQKGKKDEVPVVVTLRSGIDMIVPVILSLIVKVDGTAVSSLLLQRLVHVILQLVSAISKQVSKALADGVESELDEGEEAAGILSLNLLHGNIVAFRPYISDILRLMRQLFVLSLDTYPVFTFKADNSTSDEEQKSTVAAEEVSTPGSLSGVRALVELGRVEPQAFLTTFEGLLVGEQQDDRSLMRLASILVLWFSRFNVTTRFIQQIPHLISILCILWTLSNTTSKHTLSSSFKPLMKVVSVSDSITILIQHLHSKCPMVAYDRASTTLAVGLLNGSIQFWRFGKTQPDRTVSVSTRPVEAICFSDDGQRLSSLSAGENHIRILRVKSGSFRERLRGSHHKETIVVKGMEEEKNGSLRRSTMVWTGKVLRDGSVVQFSSLIGSGPIVVFFYHKDSSKWDQRELKGFKYFNWLMKRKSATVLGISGDKLATHAETSSNLKLKYSILSDQKYTVKKAWGVSRFLLHKHARTTMVFNNLGELEYVYKSELWPMTHAYKAYLAVKAIKSGNHLWTIEEDDNEMDEPGFRSLMDEMIREEEEKSAEKEEEEFFELLAKEEGEERDQDLTKKPRPSSSKKPAKVPRFVGFDQDYFESDHITKIDEDDVEDLIAIEDNCRASKIKNPDWIWPCFFIQMTDLIRAQIEAFMKETEGKNFSLDFTNKDVCATFLVGACPETLLSNTKADCGQCRFRHNEKDRLDYESAKKYYKGDKWGIAAQAERLLSRRIQDCDRLVQRMEESKAKENFGDPDNERVIELSVEIDNLIAAAENLGNEGKVEESLDTMHRVDALKRARDDLAAGSQKAVGHSQLRACANLHEPSPKTNRLAEANQSRVAQKEGLEGTALIVILENIGMIDGIEGVHILEVNHARHHQIDISDGIIEAPVDDIER